MRRRGEVGAPIDGDSLRLEGGLHRAQAGLARMLDNFFASDTGIRSGSGFFPPTPTFCLSRTCADNAAEIDLRFAARSESQTSDVEDKERWLELVFHVSDSRFHTTAAQMQEFSGAFRQVK